MGKIKCENRVEKDARYLSANNASGRSYQKCGRVAVVKSEFGLPLCKKCRAERPDNVTPI